MNFTGLGRSQGDSNWITTLVELGGRSHKVWKMAATDQRPWSSEH